jgi:hypothetical protein
MHHGLIVTCVLCRLHRTNAVPPAIVIKIAFVAMQRPVCTAFVVVGRRASHMMANLCASPLGPLGAISTAESCHDYAPVPPGYQAAAAIPHPAVH